MILAALLVAAPATAQGPTGRVALEALASVSTSSTAFDDPFVVLDAIGTVRLGRGWDVVVRPYGRRIPGGDWAFELYQAQLRYVSATRIPFRIDAGVIASPLGLSTLELRPDRNPSINAPFYYFAPLPAINGRFDRLHLMAGGYPLGAMFSASGAKWDVRAGVTDGTPARPRDVTDGTRRPAEAQIVVGGGVSPIFGLRIGAGFARGRYRSPSLTATLEPVAAQTATVLNLEGEYAVGYTRVQGEWVRNTFTTTLGDAVARGFNVQAVRTLSPRWFAAGRLTRATSPLATAPVEVRRTSTSVETIVGIRLTRELTVRGGYLRSRNFTAAAWTNAAIASVVWSERWW